MIRAMADSDAAFLWETEALRSATPILPPSSGPSDNGETGDIDWVTLREANQITGIPVKTLRKWARREYLPSYLEESSAGQLRMVSLTGVNDRARRLGRELFEVRPTKEHDPRPTPSRMAEPPPPERPEQPPGTMLVPIDAWDKLLLQLGNLHEAGQQLAEARERAAKAETEASFLKERLAEMRSELVETKTASHPPVAPPVVDGPSERLSHITIETPGETEDIGEDHATAAATDSPVGEPDQDETGLTVTAYSLEMLKHVYSTWRGRPRR